MTTETASCNLPLITAHYAWAISIATLLIFMSGSLFYLSWLHSSIGAFVAASYVSAITTTIIIVLCKWGDPVQL